MIRMFNFPCIFTLNCILLLNSCDGNDAKQRAFLGRLLVAVKRAGCVVLNYKTSSERSWFYSLADVPFALFLHATAFSIEQALRQWRFVICLPMCQWGAASSRWSQRLDRCLYNVHTFFHQSTDSVVNRTVWRTQIWREKVRCFLLKELDCFTSVE